MAAVGCLVVLLAVFGLWVGGAFVGAGVAKITAGPRVTSSVYSTDNIIGQVSFFERACADVAKDYAQWKTNQGALERTEREIRTGVLQDPTGSTLAQVQSQAQGPQTAIYADAADYNARSRNYTANPFKTHNLPYRISPPVGADLANWTPPTCGDKHEGEAE